MQIHQASDKFFKQSMSDPRIARDFFETHLPPEILKQVDISTLKLQKHTFIDPAYKMVEADVVYAARMGDHVAYFYLLCENQSEIDEAMAFRLLVYMVRLIELHRKQHPKDPLPLVYPLVIYTGEKIWSAPRDIFALFGQHETLARQIFLQPFQLIDVQRINDDVLRKRLWSGVVEFALKYRQVRNFANFLQVIFPWLNEIENDQGEDLAKSVLKYILSGIEAEDEALFIQKSEEYLSEKLRGEIMTLAQRFEQKGLEQGILQGMQQGMQQGILRGEYSLLLRQLERKFKVIPKNYRECLTKADMETLLVWGERVLSAKTLDEVFKG